VNNLAELYEQAGSLLALSRELGVSYSTLRYRLEKQGVEVKSKGYKAPRKKQIAKAENHHNWKGGQYKTSGYIYEYAPWHPDSEKRKGYVEQHRLVMENHIGRKLNPDELVHHINEETTDNRIENLQLMTRPEHIRYHKEKAPRDELGRFTS